MRKEIEKCDYCKKDIKYGQTLEVVNLKTGDNEIIWQRNVCEDCKDRTEV